MAWRCGGLTNDSHQFASSPRGKTQSQATAILCVAGIDFCSGRTDRFFGLHDHWRLYLRTRGKNDFLKKEIAVLDKQIDQIKRLKEQTQALLARKQIIESLQRDRAEAVRLLSELVKQMPEGVYVRAVKQEGAKITLTGYAQSSARVSTLMRNIESSPWLEKPLLIEIKAVTVDKRRLNEFSMNAVLKRAPLPDGGKL